jgi:DNA polymerase-3 subunit epsilon
VGRWFALIRPPPGEFVFTYLHGISQADTATAKTFGEHWPAIESFCSDTPILAAHNAAFDREVLQSCCRHYHIKPPQYQFVCTVQAARWAWPHWRSHTLDAVCRNVNLPLNHHDAQSDAYACSQILLRTIKAGYPVHA